MAGAGASIITSSTDIAVPLDKTEIALFTQSFPGNSHSGNKLLEAFQHKIDAIGYKLSINIIRDYEINNLCFPTNIDIDNLAGILCMEMFSKEYSEFLCKQDIPLLFVDTPLSMKCSVNADVLYMENLSSSYHLLASMIDAGEKNISFVGDRLHCQSFYERWQAYVSVLTDRGIPVDMQNCILADDSNPYSDTVWLSEQIKALPVMPDMFFCANDFLAMSTLKALRLLGKKVPRDVRICGFDDAPESTLMEPSLTTIKIHSSSMGYTAAELLLSRIANPHMPYKKTYIETDIMFRDSTIRP
jgi:LacI family transcriptional regulator